MYLTLRFRHSHSRERNGPAISLKVGFVWFEGVNDLHIQFDGPGEDNFCPVTNEGDDYLAIHPVTGKPCVLFSLEIHEEAPKHADPAPKGYAKKLMKYWPSPNRLP
jgi:hypothetical protein